MIATLPRPRVILPSVIIIIVLMLALLATIAPSMHALARHGQAAINASNCFNGKGQVMQQQMIDPLTNRRMSFCNMGGHWFVAINAEDGGNVTIFPRSFAKCLSDVISYAKRSGFTRPFLAH